MATSVTKYWGLEILIDPFAKKAHKQIFKNEKPHQWVYIYGFV